MAISTQTQNLNLIPGKSAPVVVHLSQGDVGNTIQFYLFNGDSKFIPNNMSVAVHGVRSDEKSFGPYAVSTVFNDNLVSFNVNAMMTASTGAALAEIVITDASKRQVGTANFGMLVEPAPYKSGITYEDDLSIYQRILAYVSGFKAESNSKTSFLQTQIDQLIAPSGEAPSAAEVENARIGEDGVTYTTLGNAIRTQVGNLQSSVELEALRRRNADSAMRDQARKRFLSTDSSFRSSMAKMDADHKNYVSELIDASIGLESVVLCDSDGWHLVDNDGGKLVGVTYFVKTYPTNAKDSRPVNLSCVGNTFAMNYKNMGIPVLSLEHPDILKLKSKSDGTISNVTVNCAALGIVNKNLKKLKVQGASSQAYEKKNYTLTFENDLIIKPEWGSHKKYVIKADWVDFSHMRNEIGAKIWGQVRQTRVNPTRARLVNDNGDHLVDTSNRALAGENDPCLCIGMNYGAIDAFPICVEINGNYWGLYSMTIPKDDWMANMQGESEHEAIVSAENHGNPTRFKELVNYPDSDGNMYGQTTGVVGFSMEYVSDEDDMDWLADSLNRLISASMEEYQTSQEFLNAVGEYVDIDSVIDYYIFNCLIDNGDGTDKNFLLDTWDGTKWYFATYDMDGTFGNLWNGKSYTAANAGVTFDTFRRISRLMQLIMEHDREALINRYNDLRSGVLSEYNLINTILNYSVDIPKAALDYEALRWPGRPGTNTNDHNQIIKYVELRCKFLDDEISNLQ